MGTLWHAPVLVSAHSLRPANDSEALARAFLNGEEVVPSEITGKREALENAVPAILEDEDVNPADIPIPAVFEDDDPTVETQIGLSTDEGSGSVPGTPADFPVEIPDAPNFGECGSIGRIGGI